MTTIGGTGKGTAFLVGVPGEDIGTTRDAGVVNILGANLDYYTDAILGGVNEAGDRFGASVVSWSSPARANLQAIGIPGEDSGRGAVRLAYPDKGTIWTLGPRVAGDSYGSTLAAGR